MLARRLALLCVTGALKPLVPASTRKPCTTSSSSLAQTTATSALRAVRDPHLRAVEHPAVAVAARARAHRARVAAAVGLGQAEAADDRAGRQLGEVLALLLLGAVGVDRVHDEAALHARRGAHAGVAALELVADEAVGGARDLAAAVLGGRRRPEDAELAHLRDQLAREGVAVPPALDVRDDGGVHERADGRVDVALLVGEAVERPEVVEHGSPCGQEVRTGLRPPRGARPWLRACPPGRRRAPLRCARRRASGGRGGTPRCPAGRRRTGVPAAS